VPVSKFRELSVSPGNLVPASVYSEAQTLPNSGCGLNLALDATPLPASQTVSPDGHKLPTLPPALGLAAPKMWDCRIDRITKLLTKTNQSFNSLRLRLAIGEAHWDVFLPGVVIQQRLERC